MEKNLSNLPMGVRIARATNFLAGGISILLPLLSLVKMATRQEMNRTLAEVNSTLGIRHAIDATHRISTNPFLLLLLLLLGVIFFWQAYNLKKLRKSAYVIQLVISILGVLTFPVGTIIYGIVIFFMLRKDTREAFGMG